LNSLTEIECTRLCIDRARGTQAKIIHQNQEPKPQEWTSCNRCRCEMENISPHLIAKNTAEFYSHMQSHITSEITNVTRKVREVLGCCALRACHGWKVSSRNTGWLLRLTELKKCSLAYVMKSGSAYGIGTPGARCLFQYTPRNIPHGLGSRAITELMASSNAD